MPLSEWAPWVPSLSHFLTSHILGLPTSKIGIQKRAMAKDGFLVSFLLQPGMDCAVATSEMTGETGLDTLFI
jgi:hypothetical protein